jgi:release factor glutamine methyltransferase
VAAALGAAGLDEARRRARQLVAAALDLSATEVFARPERALIAGEATRVAAMLRRAVAHEPLSRILGKREFWGLEFDLCADTLDPRPDSESVVEAVLARLADRAAPWRLIDLGSGTGCLLLALLTEYPQASGVGIDIAPGATRAARHNAARLGLADRARFVAGNWLQSVVGAFDVVVANPPYIATADLAGLPPEVSEHDPRRALDGGPDGLAEYRAIAAGLPLVLRPGGLFVAEIGCGQEDVVAAILARGGLALDGFARDLAGIVRCVAARR